MLRMPDNAKSIDVLPWVSSIIAAHLSSAKVPSSKLPEVVREIYSALGHLEKPSVISTVVIRFGIESKEGGDGGSARLLRRGWSAELAFGGGGPVGTAGLGGGLRAVPGRPGAGPEAFGAGEGRTATL